MKIKKNLHDIDSNRLFFLNANLAHSVNDFSKHHGVVVTRPMAAFPLRSDQLKNDT